MANQNLTVQLEAMSPTPLVAGCTTVVANAATTTQTVKVPSTRTAAGTVSATFSIQPGSVGSNSCPGTIMYKATLLPATNVAILTSTSDQAGLSIQPSVQIVTSEFATPFVGVGKSSTLQVSARASAGLVSAVSVGIAPVGSSSGQCFSTAATAPQPLPPSTTTSQLIPLSFGVQANTNGQEVKVGCGGPVTYRASFGTLPSGVMSLSAQDDSATLTVLGQPKADVVTPGELQTGADYVVEDEFGNAISSDTRNVPLGIVNKLIGNAQTLTITGKDLFGAQVEIAQEKLNPDLPDRASPTTRIVQNQSNDELKVEVVVSNAEVVGFYTMTIRTDGGETDLEFRVLPNGPVVESYTPHHVTAGNSYILSIEGENLQLTDVQLAADAVGLLRLLNLQVDSQRQTVTGLLIVGTGVGLSDLGVGVHLRVGSISLTIKVYPQPTLYPPPDKRKGGDCLRTMDDGGSSASEADDCQQQLIEGVPIYYQPPKLVKSKADLAAEAKIAARQFGGGVCRFRRKFAAKRFQMALGVCVNGSGVNAEYNPDTSQCWAGAKTGAVEVKVIVILLFFQVELEVAWGWVGPWVCVPATWPVYCLRGYAGAEVVGGRGFVYSVSSCQGVGMWESFNAGGGAIQTPLITVQGTGSSCFSVTPNETTKDLAPENPGVIGLKFTNNCCNNEIVDVRFNTSGARTFDSVSFDWFGTREFTYGWGFTQPPISNALLGSISTVPDPENPVCWDPKLEITAPDRNTTLYITHDKGVTPFMPMLPDNPETSVRITGVSPDPTANTTFHWEAEVVYNTRQNPSYRRVVKWSGDVQGGRLPLDFFSNHVGTIEDGRLVPVAGGEVTFKVSATVNGQSLTRTFEGPRILVQDNPSKVAVQLALNNGDAEQTEWLQKIACQESRVAQGGCPGATGQRQFVLPDQTNSSCCANLRQCPGEPVSAMNGDGGFGIMQITNPKTVPPDSANLWYWLANVQEGQNRFRTALGAAQRYPGRVRDSIDFNTIWVNETNRWRQSQNMELLDEIIVLDFGWYNVVEPDGTRNRLRNLLVEDAVRCFNGCPNPLNNVGQFGLNWHEFRLRTETVQINLPDGTTQQLRILSVENERVQGGRRVADAIWERIPVNSRPATGDPNYVERVRGRDPTCPN
jgi:hypothetical protein